MVSTSGTRNSVEAFALPPPFISDDFINRVHRVVNPRHMPQADGKGKLGWFE